MDTAEAISDRLRNGENIVKDLSDKCFSGEAKDADKVSLSSRIPLSPDLDEVSGDLPLEFTSPSTVLTSPPEVTCIDSHQHFDDQCYRNEDSPCTPKEDFFDPFAAGLDKFMLAPLCRKFVQEQRNSAARCLNFNSSVKFVGDIKCESDGETTLDEELLLETVYVDLLEVIASSQAISVHAVAAIREISMMGSVADDLKTPDDFMTPTCGGRLGVSADTCPGAPMKETRKFRNIDKGLCRKLDF